MFIKYVWSTSVLVALLLSSFHSQAEISFSRYRISLDDKQRNMSLLVSNNGDNKTRCTLGFSHRQVQPDGNVRLVKSADEIFNSADKMVRFSPRRVTIPGGGSQTVRLSLKRQRNAKAGEYVSYLQLGCRDISKTEDGPALQPRIQAQINYNIPIVARRGKLEASATFTEPKLIGDQLHININRQGNRSIYGVLTVTDTATDKVIGIKNGLSVYLPIESRQLVIPLKNAPQGTLAIRFEETAINGGDIDINTTLSN